MELGAGMLWHAGLPVAFVRILGKGLMFSVTAGGVFCWYFEPSFLSRDDGFLFCADGFPLVRE
jgi:hypothetical protein